MEFKSKTRGSFKGLAILFFFVIFLPTVLIPIFMSDQLTTGHYILFSVMAVIDIFLIGIFWYMGKSSEVRIENGSLIYKMLTTRTIPLSSIQSLDLDVKNLGGQIQRQILVLWIQEISGRKTKIHIQFFENFEELLRILVKETGRKLEVSELAKVLIKEMEIKL